MFRIIRLSQLFVQPLPTTTPDNRQSIALNSYALIHVLFTAENFRPCNPDFYLHRTQSCDKTRHTARHKLRLSTYRASTTVASTYRLYIRPTHSLTS